MTAEPRVTRDCRIPHLPLEAVSMIIDLVSREGTVLCSNLTLVCKSWAGTMMQKHAAVLEERLAMLEDQARAVTGAINANRDSPDDVPGWMQSEWVQLNRQDDEEDKVLDACSYISTIVQRDAGLQHGVMGAATHVRAMESMYDLPLRVYVYKQWDEPHVWNTFDCQLNAITTRVKTDDASTRMVLDWVDEHFGSLRSLVDADQNPCVLARVDSKRFRDFTSKIHAMDALGARCLGTTKAS